MNTKLIIFVASFAILSEAYIVKPKFVIDMDDDLNGLEQKPLSPSRAHVDEMLYIPMNIKACSNGICELGCQILGYPHGRCIGPNTCQCYS